MENELQNQINSSTGSESEDVLENRIKNGLERWAEWFSSSFLCNAHLQVSHLPNRGKRRPPEGLARIFAEALNRTGLSLSVFSIC